MWRSLVVAHLRTRKRSPFWILRRRNLDTGKWEEETTGLRVDSDEDTRKAQRKADRTSAEEQRVAPPGRSPAFAAWVPLYLAEHWNGKTGDSPRRYKGAWQAVRRFLDEHDIIYPRQVRYEHGRGYLEWRLRTRVHDRDVGHNTALLELKFLGQLLNESIRLGFSESNPLQRLGIGRKATKEKPELTDSQIKKLRRAIADEPEWMRVAFEIALYTGCRFNETSIPFEQIDFRRGTIKIRDSKRQETDERKFFEVPLPYEIRPMLIEMKRRRLKKTCELSQDKNGRINKLFKRCKVEASFHSLRVTFITRCHRAGMSESEAMRLVNHSSKLVHKVYSKLNVEDARALRKRLRLPPPAP